MTASREAYDLHNPACRANAWYRLKRGDWKRLWFLRLIWSDTINNVCTVRKANTKFRDAGGQSHALRTDDQPHSL